MKLTGAEKVFKTVNAVLLAGVMLVTLYPLIYVLSMSVSSVDAIMGNKVFLWPIGFQIETYKRAFVMEGLSNAFYNTLVLVALGTALNILLTMSIAYVLSRKAFVFVKPLSIFIIIPMLFSGGLLPLFMLIRALNLYNTIWAVVLPYSISIWNIIITRVFISQNIPESLIEAAKIDGYGDARILLSIVFPLSKAIIAIIGLYTAVTIWNQYFFSVVFTPDKRLKPLQSLLIEILLNSNISMDNTAQKDPLTAARKMLEFLQMKYVLVIISIMPIMAVYPFIQKYFAKGVMIGAVKG